jgi:hypothetical protein
MGYKVLKEDREFNQRGASPFLFLPFQLEGKEGDGMRCDRRLNYSSGTSYDAKKKGRRGRWGK